MSSYSENRRAKLIDQTRDETKDAHKKLEKFRAANDVEIKNLKATIYELQQRTHKKNAQLKVSTYQNNQLQNIKTRSIIMKLENEQKSKDAIISESDKNNNLLRTTQILATG